MASTVTCSGGLRPRERRCVAWRAMSASGRGRGQVAPLVGHISRGLHVGLQLLGEPPRGSGPGPCPVGGMRPSHPERGFRGVLQGRPLAADGYASDGARAERDGDGPQLGVRERICGGKPTYELRSEHTTDGAMCGRKALAHSGLRDVTRASNLGQRGVLDVPEGEKPPLLAGHRGHDIWQVLHHPKPIPTQSRR